MYKGFLVGAAAVGLTVAGCSSEAPSPRENAANLTLIQTVENKTEDTVKLCAFVDDGGQKKILDSFQQRMQGQGAWVMPHTSSMLMYEPPQSGQVMIGIIADGAPCSPMAMGVIESMSATAPSRAHGGNPDGGTLTYSGKGSLG